MNMSNSRFYSAAEKANGKTELSNLAQRDGNVSEWARDRLR